MAIDWSNIFNLYKGRWLALKDDEQTVVGVGETAEEALAEAKNNGYAKPILTHIPEKLLAYVGFGL